MPADPEEIVCIDGKDTRLGDVPYPLRAMFGLGHQPGYEQEGRKVQPGEWPYAPQSCLVADETGRTRWTEDDTILVCTGCGLDCT